jgi:hypothetical protein
MACSVFSPIPLPRPRPNRLRVLASLKSIREASHRQSGDVRRNRALNCWPWVRSLIHSPEAVIHSPAAMAAGAQLRSPRPDARAPWRAGRRNHSRRCGR